MRLWTCPARQRFASILVLIASASFAMLLPATAARAEIIETSTITNSYSYIFNREASVPVPVEARAGLRVSRVDGGGYTSEVGIDLTGNLADGSFDFLHNAYCVGACGVQITTEIIFTIKNIGSMPVEMRFDSLITPGHLAQTKSIERSEGHFDFQVTQENPTGVISALYKARGGITTGPPIITTSDGSIFNGLTFQGNGDEWQVADWSATNLHVLLNEILPGETHILRYTSTVLIGTLFAGGCIDLTDCGGIQVAFGDPRTTGSIGGRMAAATLEPVIGRAFDAYTPYAEIVSKDAPLKPPEPIIPPPAYGPLFVSQVPEPASWALMITGFALIGGLHRSRRPNEPLPLRHAVDIRTR